MEESNIFFSTNTYNYGSFYSGETRNRFKDRKGDVSFFKNVIDYDALYKLKNSFKMGGTLNSDYYVANISQIRVLDPTFLSVMVNSREKDFEIERENKIKDLEYGYTVKNNFYPLLEEIIIDDEDLTYADDILGEWIRTSEETDTIDDNSYGIYIKQKIQRDNSLDTIAPEDSGLEDIEDVNPYYYLYEDFARKARKISLDIDKAKLYEDKYGSIFRAFSEVSQDEIIQSPINQYSFVNAGPGTGKTYTLMKKILYMINSLQADPEGILVLCFTNAAVNEIKNRINLYAERERDRSFINVDVRTFHSFSWLLISQANDMFINRPNYKYIDILKLNYDQSIREATRIIREFGDEVFGGVEHLIIDEIQDLTNERASLVIAMIKECIKNNVGFTVLGDSCQSIYDYADEYTSYEMKSERFYKYLFSELFDCGVFYKLEKNHRQTKELIELTNPLRQAIINGKKIDIRQEIISIYKNVPEIIKGSASVKLSEFIIKEMTKSETVCFMCRNNAQVLATSANLWKRGIEHVLNAYNEFEYLADWIGKIFALYTKDNISFDEFNKQYIKVNTNCNSIEVWKRLQDSIGSQNNVLKVKDILSVVAKSKVDDPVFRNVPKGNLIVSNIHKSKGREYDTVILEKKFVNRLVNDSTKIKSVNQYIEEAKTLYVAVTRPKKRIFINSLATTDVTFKKIKTGRERWARGDGRNLKSIEIRALTDANIDSFNMPDLQTYIKKFVSLGDEINIVMDHSTRLVNYNIIHISDKGERIIGKCSSELLEDIEAIILPHKSPWPKRITDLYVSGIHTNVASDYRSAWCWVDFCGIGTAVTDVY